MTYYLYLMCYQKRQCLQLYGTANVSNGVITLPVIVASEVLT